MENSGNVVPCSWVISSLCGKLEKKTVWVKQEQEQVVKVHTFLIEKRKPITKIEDNYI
jgi:hypothetical protein